MTAEARAWWVRFQQERKEQREKQDTWRPKDWWGEPGRGGIGKTEGKGKGEVEGEGKWKRAMRGAGGDEGNPRRG